MVLLIMLGGLIHVLANVNASQSSLISENFRFIFAFSITLVKD